MTAWYAAHRSFFRCHNSLKNCLLCSSKFFGRRGEKICVRPFLLVRRRRKANLEATTIVDLRGATNKSAPNPKSRANFYGNTMLVGNRNTPLSGLRRDKLGARTRWSHRIKMSMVRNHH
jgi:hypothetical protein